MTVHKEGLKILRNLFLILLGINVATLLLSDNNLVEASVVIISVLIYLFVIRFFRKPTRQIILHDNKILAPADGTVVVIEETNEDEYLKSRRVQVSIFMSVWNVHINWFPINGVVKYFKYHPGQFLIARNPKSSTLNERTTVVVESKNGVEILFRQIAGLVARRIVCYAKPGTVVAQNQETGFIKFGSRVDIFLPLDAKVKVGLNQKVTGTHTVIAEL